MTYEQIRARSTKEWVKFEYKILFGDDELELSLCLKKMNKLDFFLLD